MSAVDFDYLALEPLLVDRITTELAGHLKAVQGAADLASITIKQQTVPAVYVIYLGDSVGQASGNAQPINQIWAVVLAVHYADATGTGEGARRIAGPLIGRLLAALNNWKPRQDINNLRRVQSNTPAEYADNFGYFPLLFSSGFVYTTLRSSP